MWRLGRSLPEERPHHRSSARPDLAESLTSRERALGLLPGNPFLLRPDGAADPDVIAFFASSTFKLLVRAVLGLQRRRVSSRGRSYDEFRGEQDLLMLVPRVAGLVQQQFGCCASEESAGLAD